MNDMPGFEVVPVEGEATHETVIAGIGGPDLAGLTAVDYLLGEYESTRIASIRTRGLPDVAAVTDGIPRHPVRLHRIDPLELSVLVSEVFIPVSLADRFADAIAAWLGQTEIASVTLLYGAQFPHGEAQHVPFLAAPERYRTRVGEVPLEPLSSGLLDGIAGELLLRGMEDGFPDSGVIVTPAHLPGPDVEAALRLLDGLARLHDVAIDTTDLETRWEQLRDYYEGIAERMQAIQEADGTATTRDFPEDRMYM